MVFNKKKRDKVVINVLRQEKGYGEEKKFINEFPNRHGSPKTPESTQQRQFY